MPGKGGLFELKDGLFELSNIIGWVAANDLLQQLFKLLSPLNIQSEFCPSIMIPFAAMTPTIGSHNPGRL